MRCITIPLILSWSFCSRISFKVCLPYDDGCFSTLTSARESINRYTSSLQLRVWQLSIRLMNIFTCIIIKHYVRGMIIVQPTVELIEEFFNRYSERILITSSLCSTCRRCCCIMILKDARPFPLVFSPTES